jgi:hypothetical protein
VRRFGGFVSQPVLAAAPFNWRKLLASRQQVPPFLSEFAAEAGTAAIDGRAPVGAAAAGSAGRLAGLSAAERKQQLMGEVSAVITNLLGTGGGAALGKCNAGSVLLLISLQQRLLASS